MSLILAFPVVLVGFGFLALVLSVSPGSPVVSSFSWLLVSCCCFLCSFLAQPPLLPSSLLRCHFQWITLKAVPFITTWLGPLYASKPPGGASPFLRAIHWMGRSYAFFTFSLRPSDIKRPPHLRSFTSVVASTNNGVTWGYPVTHGGKSWTQPSSYHYAPSILHGRRPYFYHACGRSKSSSPQLLTHNRRRDKKWRQFQKLELQWLREVATLAHFPSHQRPLLEASTQMTPTVTQHQELLPLMTTWIQTSTMATATIQHPTSPPPFLQAPPHSHWHQTQRHHHFPPFVSCSQIQLIHLVIHPFVHGPTQMIKSWSAWNRTQSPVHRGRRSVPDFIAILMVCKLRWGILKQTPGVIDQHGRVNPPLEPEAED